MVMFIYLNGHTVKMFLTLLVVLYLCICVLFIFITIVFCVAVVATRDLPKQICLNSMFK